MEDNKRETRAPIQSAAAELAGAAVSKLDTGRAADSLPLRPLVETVGILEDDDIRLLSDGLPLGESGGLHDLMDEAEVIARAMAASGADLSGLGLRARLVLCFRAWYLLGAQRGAEAYRAELVAQNDSFKMAPPMQEMPFELIGDYTEFFADALADAPASILRRLYSVTGLEVLPNG